MNHFAQPRILWGLLCAALTFTSHAGTYQVNSAESLRAALQTAQTNGEDDYILLADGSYATGELGPFKYESAAGDSLTLIGNETIPGNVVLQGSGYEEVLALSNGTAGGIFTVRGVTLVSDGQGLVTRNGETRVEHSTFTTHTAMAPASTELLSLQSDGTNRIFRRSPETDLEAQRHKNDDKKESDDGLEDALNQNGTWLLLGSTFTIYNMSIFNNYHAVWAYQNGQWRAYSANPAIRARLASMQIGELDRIPAYSGFWVWRD